MLLYRRRKARNSFLEFCRYIAPDEPPALHHQYLCGKLQDVIDGKIRRLIIMMPPGSAKSTYASVYFPAYYLAVKGKKSIIASSYGEDLAVSFGRRVRNLVDSNEYYELFPEVVLSSDQKARGQWETAPGGAYKAVGVGSGVTGRRGDLVIVDDPIKGREEADSELVRQKTWEWYKADLFTRMKPGAAQIFILTRWHEDDPVGRILPDSWNGESGVFKGYDGQDWHVVCIPAEARENDVLGRKPGEMLWLEWFTEEFWAETKAAQMATDVRNWLSLYQQVPRAEEGTFFKREWFKRFNLGDQPERLYLYGASDYAVTEGGGDFTEHGICGFDTSDDLWFIDWWSGQCSPDVWFESQFNLVTKHKPMLWVAEAGVIRRSVEGFINRDKRDRRIPFRQEWIPAVADKVANARAFQALAACGRVYIPKCEWGDLLIEQLVAFPAGKYDDKVDVCGLFGRVLDETYSPRKLAKKLENTEPGDYRRHRQSSSEWKTL